MTLGQNKNKNSKNSKKKTTYNTYMKKLISAIDEIKLSWFMQPKTTRAKKTKVKKKVVELMDILK